MPGPQSYLLVVMLATAAWAAAATALSAVAAPSSQAGKRLIQLSADEAPTWMDEATVLSTLVKHNVQFMDVTAHPEEDRKPRVPSLRVFPAGPTHQAEAAKYLAAADIAEAEANLVTLSSFFTRYYRSDTGVQSAEWLFGRVQEYARGSASNITVTQFAHSDYEQQSVIARFEGRDPSQPLVILGAHQDSINSNNPTTGRSPGADDDGSGSVTILEAFRVLAAGGFNPIYPVEFQWYAAEEVGLLGSQDIAAAYREQGVAVYGMLQLDMTAYTDDLEKPVKIIMDYVDRDLSLFTAQLVDAYTTLSWRQSLCLYACSDHASFNRSGYAAAHTFEPVTCPEIHQTGDDLDLIVWPLLEQFILYAIGYAIEMSFGP